MRVPQTLTGPGAFRLFLATVVVVHHLSRLALGEAAVYIFFCLSGYWICRMWRERYSKAYRPYATYLISRSWRLLPTFILIAALAISLDVALGHSLSELKGTSAPWHFVASHLFILGYDRLAYQPLLPAWSLDYEMQFYLVAPVLVLVARKTSRPGATVLVAGLLSLVSSVLLGPHILTTYLAFFWLGMIAETRSWTPSRKLVAWAALGALLLLLCVGVAGRFKTILLMGAHPGTYAYLNPELNVAVSLLLIPFALYTTKQRGSSRDSMLADLSYVVYLLHWPAMKLLEPLRKHVPSRLAATGLLVSMVYAGSVLLWRGYDRPINRLRSRWVSRRLRDAPARSATVIREVPGP